MGFVQQGWPLVSFLKFDKFDIRSLLSEKPVSYKKNPKWRPIVKMAAIQSAVLLISLFAVSGTH